jgi:mono/diheme cytochrome c family protein
MLAVLSIVLLLAAYGLAEMSKAKQKKEAAKQIDTTTISEPIEVGKLIYGEKCAVCHGSDGKLGLSGAKDLSVTQLSVEEQKVIIRNGKSSMIPFNTEAISDEQLDGLTQYLATLKQ